MTLPRLYLISDADRVGEERFLEVLAAALSAGLEWVQLREPGWPAERLRSLAARVVEMAPAATIVLGCRPRTIGERRRIVDELDLGGLHLGGASPEHIGPSRRGAPRASLFGYSAHAPFEVEEAFGAGADYVSFSPVFRPLSKEKSAAPTGTRDLARACDRSRGPLFALGGITTERVPPVLRAGAHGIAVIGAIVDRADPALATRSLLDALSRGRRLR